MARGSSPVAGLPRPLQWPLAATNSPLTFAGAAAASGDCHCPHRVPYYSPKGAVVWELTPLSESVNHAPRSPDGNWRRYSFPRPQPHVLEDEGGRIGLAESATTIQNLMLQRLCFAEFRDTMAFMIGISSAGQTRQLKSALSPLAPWPHVESFSKCPKDDGQNGQFFTLKPLKWLHRRQKCALSSGSGNEVRGGSLEAVALPDLLQSVIRFDL